MSNSDVYLIGKGFKGGVYFKHPYIKAMFDRIFERIPVDVPIFDAKEFPKEYLTTVIKSTKDLVESQINKLELDINRTNKCLNSRYRGPSKEEPTVKEFYKSIESDILEWYKSNPILPIYSAKKLIMNDLFGQS
jgi:hypothetical protein